MARKDMSHNLKTRYPTTEEAREMQKRGVESRKKRKRERLMGQELARAILGENLPNNTLAWQPIRKMLEDAGFNPDEVSFEMAMHIVQLIQALREGDVKSYTALLKVAGLMEERHDVNFHDEVIIKFGE